jgi:branched-chain amino acid transport system substrate-binding protein
MKKVVVLCMAMLFVLSITVNGAPSTIKIGFYGPLTGPTAQSGIASKNGAIVAINFVNKAGGVNGKKIELIDYDDKSSPEQAVKVVTRMVEVDKVHGIIGSLHSGNILASAPVVEKAQIPEIGIGTSPKWLQQGYKYLFRPLPNTSWVNVYLIKTIKDLKLTRAGVLYRSDEYGKTGYDGIKAEAAKVGVKIVAVESYQPGDTDFTGQLAKIINAKIDALILYAVTSDYGIMMKQVRQQGYDGYTFGTEAFSLPEIKKIAGKAANKAIYAAPYVMPEKPGDTKDPLERKFLKAYVAKFKAMPASDCSYRTFDAVNIFVEAIKKAKSLDGTVIRDVIENITDLKGLAGTFNFKGNNGESINSIRTYIIQNGKDIFLSEYLKRKNK